MKKNINWFTKNIQNEEIKQAGLKELGQAATLGLIGGLSGFLPSDAEAKPKTPTKQVQQVQKKQQAHADFSGIPQEVYDILLKEETKSGHVELGMYPDSKGIPTIGIGFNLRSNHNLAWHKFHDSWGYSDKEIKDIFNGRKNLTLQQAKELSAIAIKQHLVRAKKLVPGLNGLPGYVQAAIVSAVYRGDLGPKTAALINKGDFASASREYLNDAEYKKDFAKKNKNKKYPQAIGADGRGVSGRMERNALIFQRYAKEKGQIK